MTCMFFSITRTRDDFSGHTGPKNKCTMSSSSRQGILSNLSDLGLTSSTTGDKIIVEHVIVLSTSKAMEDILRQGLGLLMESAREVISMGRVMAFGITGYLILSGISKWIDSKDSKRDKM
jgi:hypothetical protein